MKKLILAVMIVALAGSQVQTAKAGVQFGVGVGVCGIGVGASFGIGCGRPYYSCYNSPYYCGPRPYCGAGFYNSGYYYPDYYNYSPNYYGYSPAATAPVAQTYAPAQPAPQNVTINNYYNSGPSTPMSGANSLFGR